MNIKNLTMLALVTLLLSGCDQYDGADSNTGAENGSATEGAQLYSELNCAFCHGSDGQTPALGVSRIIADIEDKRDIENALYALRSGAPDRNQAMLDEAATLSDEEIIALSAYIQTL